MNNFPNTHALLIGIANYHHIRPLPAIVLNDVQAIANTLLDPTVCVYSPENVHSLLDNQATQSSIRQAFAYSLHILRPCVVNQLGLPLRVC